MKKLSLMAALCISGLAYASTAAENVQIPKEQGSFETKVSEQDTVKRKPDTTKIPKTPDRRIPTDPNKPNPSPSPMPPSPSDPKPTPTNPTPSPTPSSPGSPSSPSPTGPR
jgi:hypothetical protein